MALVFDDFDVAIRDASGEYHAWKRTPDLKVVKNDPYAAHDELIQQYTDKNMHDIAGLPGDLEMNLRTFASALLAAAALYGQEGLDPAKLMQPPIDTWPMYHGDYSGRRFSTLTKINSSNVDSLTLAWVYRTGVGGIKATPLQINGVLYFSAPDHVWAVDARTGRELWHFAWQSKGGIHIGNRGVAVYGNWLYFLTPDCNFVSLNIKDGKERWHKTNCDLDQFYYGSVAPLVVKNHIITGVSGDDLDRPGYSRSYDPETGRPAMALVHRAAEEGRSRLRDLAQRRGHEARRRHDVAGAHLRSGA